MFLDLFLTRPSPRSSRRTVDAILGLLTPVSNLQLCNSIKSLLIDFSLLFSEKLHKKRKHLVEEEMVDVIWDRPIGAPLHLRRIALQLLFH